MIVALDGVAFAFFIDSSGTLLCVTLTVLLPVPAALRSLCLCIIPIRESGAGIGPGLGFEGLRHPATISLQDFV